MKRILPLTAAAMLVLADQLSKLFFATNYQLGESHNLLGELVKFTYIHNYGAAMGMLAGAPWVFNIITTAVVLVGIFLIATGRIGDSLLNWAFTLVVAGGIGNMIDRLTNGYVVDFIDCSGLCFPWIFNVADCCVVIGCCLIMLHYLLEMARESRQKREGEYAKD